MSAKRNGRMTSRRTLTRCRSRLRSTPTSRSRPSPVTAPAARRSDCGAEANAANYLAGEAGFKACEATVLAEPLKGVM